MPHPTPISRRNFVLSAAALPILGSLATARAAQPQTPTLRIGLIGCGGRGTGAAIQALRADPNTTLVAMGDVFEDRLKSSLAGITEELGAEAATRVQVPAEKKFIGFDAYQKVIDAGVDVVILTTYPAFRPVQLAAAIAAGKHVFAEKPLAADAAGIRSCLESARLAKEKNLALMVGFCWRHNPGMKSAFDQVASGGIGDIVTVHTTYHTSTLTKRPRQPGWTDMEFQMRNWWHFAWISGDHIVEQAIHSIDRMAWAMNDRIPARVNCLGGRAARTGDESGDVFDHFAAIYEYDDGSRAFHSTRQIDSCPSDNTDYIYGTKGRCTINGWAPLYEIRNRKNEVEWKGNGTPEEASEMYQNEHNALFQSIRANTPINDAVRSANSCMMAIMARMSAYTGQTVTWDQAMNAHDNMVPEHLALGDAPPVNIPIPGKTKITFGKSK